jgi:hypothetical protein
MESSLHILVDSQSNGKLRFEVKKIKLDIIKLRFDFKDSEIFTVDSLNAESGYRIKAERISVDLHSLLSIISVKHLIVDSVIIKSPSVELTKYKDFQIEKVSLPEEINRIYQSLEGALKVFNLNYLNIRDAKFTIDDRSDPATKPISVSDVNLTVSNFSGEEVPGKNRFLFADRILLEVFNQDILLPDGFHGVKFKRLRLSTRSQTIKLDSCYVYGLPADTLSGKFKAFFDSLRISNLDFNLLVKNNALKVDSAICYNPDIYFKLFISDSAKKVDLLNDSVASRELVAQKIKDLLGNLEIGYLGVRNANVKVITEKEKKENIFESQGSNFSMGNFVVNKNQKVPIKLEHFDLDIRNYLGYSPDSLYVAGFDGVEIKNKIIQLINFRINPTAKNRDPNKKIVKMQAFEIDDINWPVLIYEHRIVAGYAMLIKPDLSIVLPKADKSNTSKKEENPFAILSKIREKIGISNLYIKDGNVKIKVRDGSELAVSNCFAGIDFNQLLASENVVRLIDAVDTFSFGNGSFKNTSIQLSLNKVSYSQLLNSLYFGQIKQNKTDQSSVTSIKDARIDGINIKTVTDIELSRLSWSQAELFLNLPKKIDDSVTTVESKREMKLTLNKLTGGSTILRLRGERIEASTNVNRISTDEIILRPRQKLVINNLNIAGQSISLLQDQIEGSISLFNIHDQKESVIENVKLTIPLKDEKLSVFVPRLVFSSDINESIGGKLTAGFIEFHQPEFTFLPLKSKTDLIPKKGESKIPQIEIGNLIIDQPEFKNLPASLSGRLKVDPGNLQINVLGINSNNESVNLDSIKISVSNPEFSNNKIRLNNTGKESLFLAGSNLVFRPAKGKTEAFWSGKIDSFKSSGLKLNLLQNDSVKQTVTIGSFNFDNLILSGEYLKDRMKLIDSNADFSVSDGNIVFENNKIHFEAQNLGFNRLAKSLSVDSLAFYPVVDRDAFMATKAFQSNYIQFYSGPITGINLDVEKAVKDSVFNMQRITAKNLLLGVYKDKRLPFQHYVEKPFLTEMLKMINLKFAVDTVVIRNSGIEYEEFNDKTQLYGKINFTNIRGGITDVRNYNFTATDSLRFNVYARFMNATYLRMGFEQSYTDSLAGFHLKLITNSFDLRKLNPLLEPFVSAQVKTGYLDTLWMSVTGRKYVANGLMKMHYHGLNVQYLDKGNEEQQSLKAKTISFFANRIVRKNNWWRTGHVYAERDPEKGFVNYWVKILVGGVLTNTGVRTNKKQDKKYEKGLKMHDVQAIPDIPVDY